MSGFQPREYTLEEARAALPRVRAFMDQAQAARREILNLEPDLWPEIAASAGNGHSVSAGRAVEHYDGLRKAVRAIQGMGVIVQDIDTGLIDFLSVRDGRQVFLCWKQGEAELTWWHEIDAGFAGRQPLHD